MPEDLPPTLVWEYKRTPEPLAMVADAEALDRGDYQSAGVEVERDAARQVLQEIRDTIDERSRYYVIEQVVLGVESYIDADVYCRCAYGERLEGMLAPDVTVVPGDMIEPVIPAEQRVEEHLFDEEGDDG